jgi:hypothetical protein
MSARGITPVCNESLADAAVRAVCTINGFSSHLIPIVRRIFGEEQPPAGSDEVWKGTTNVPTRAIGKDGELVTDNTS